VFCLLGDSENAITKSIAWTLSRCPTFLSTLLGKIAPKANLGDVQIATQTCGDDRGFTDIEIYENGVLHVIVEAKRGWWLPQESQFERYLPRFRKTLAPLHARFLISMSEASELYAGLRLPKSIKSVPLKHMSWRQVLRIVRNSQRMTKSLDEKRWLGQLSLFLGGITTMQKQSSNEVYVVSLSPKEILPKSKYTWIDVVEKDSKYFHPARKRGYPAEPPNYVGFRYKGALQSIHHVDKYEVVQNLQKRNKKWPKTDEPHFVYTLGLPMRPAKRIGAGRLYRNMPIRCLIDTLLSGEFETISDAHNASKRRLELPEE
jgi:hypothetical protein